MAALALSGDAARDFLVELESSAEVAALNSSHSVTISGLGAEIERLESEAKRRGLWFRALDLDFAFHSRQMDPISKDLLASLSGLSSRRPNARLVSTVTGEGVEGEPLDADYWWRNIRSPVRFAEATGRLIEEGYRIFVKRTGGCWRAFHASPSMPIRFRRLRHAATSQVMTSLCRRTSMVRPIRADFRSTLGTGRNSGSTRRSRPPIR